MTGRLTCRLYLLAALPLLADLLALSGTEEEPADIATIPKLEGCVA